MNEQTRPDGVSQALTKAKTIDQVAAGAMHLFEQAGSFEAELSLAHAISQMRALLTPDVMQPVMALMNTDLGFRTDKDPNLIDQKTGKLHTPYAVDIVREVFIEAKLRGFHTAGNEFNIIAGRFYGAKNGFRRKVTRFPGLSEFKDIYDVPKTAGDKGAIVKARASWKLNGTPDSIEIEIPVRINAYMGTDAILGKAERKLLKRIHDRITGQNTPDGEIGDPEINVTPDAGPQKPAMEPKPAQTTTATTETKQAAPVEAAFGRPEPGPLQKDLANVMERNGITVDEFQAWLKATGLYRDAYAYPSFLEMPDAVCEICAKETAQFGKFLKGFSKVKGGGK